MIAQKINKLVLTPVYIIWFFLPLECTGCIFFESTNLIRIQAMFSKTVLHWTTKQNVYWEQLNLNYPDLLGLNKIHVVLIIEGLDNQKYEY